MEFSDVLAARRMVRNYEDKPVPEEVIDRIVYAGTRAPSAGFSQGQRLIVVTEAARRKAIARASGEEKYVAQGFDPWISKAPAHIVLCTRPQDYADRYSEPDKRATGAGSDLADWPVPYWWVDAGASLMAILLAAVNEGIAAGFLGAHAVGDLRETLDVPKGVEIVGIVTIGYAAKDRRSGSLDRGWHDLEDVVFREKWTG